MFKLLSQYNYLRQVSVRFCIELSKTCKNERSIILSTPSCTNNVSRSLNSRDNSSDSRIRKFFEYPDVNEADNDGNIIPYTMWEGAENRYAHSIMEKDVRYSSTISKIPVTNLNNIKNNIKLKNSELDELLSRNFRLSSLQEVVNNFRKISHNANENDCDIYSQEYDNIVDHLTENTNLFNNKQIINVLKSLSLWFIQTRDDDSSYSKLCTALDIECAKRADSWSVNKLLLVTDHWYRLRLIKKSHFVQTTFVKLGRNPEDLSLENFVQFLFYACVSRSSLISFRKVEYGLKKHSESLNIDELAIVSLAFFKTQNQIRDRRVIAMIVKKTIEKIDSINDYSLAGILKVVRYSIALDDLDFLCQLLENTIPQIPRLSIACLAHVILAAANRSLFYAELLNAVTAKFHKEISKIRLKDIRCLVFALSSFNYVPEKEPNLFERIIKELGESNRQNEVRKFPQCFASCLHHLSILNIHPKNLIAKALDPKSIKRAYGSNVDTIRQEILALDLNIEVEIPDYRGPRLDTRTRKYVAMRLTDAVQWQKNSKLTSTDYFMLDVIRSCEEYLGSKEMVHVDHVLPQYQRPDIIVCLDRRNYPIPISSLLSEIPFGSVKHPPKIDTAPIKWIALVIGSSNSYAKNTNRLLGHMCAKHRQLEHIGYSPCLIFWQDWMQLKNNEQKFQYLQQKVFC